MQSNHYDIVVVGGGMVGAALACALGNSALKVAVLEQSLPATPTPDYDLRVSAISLASQALFENVSAWPRMLARRVAPVREMQIWDAGGSGSIHFNAAEIGEACLAWIVENNVIQAALHERLHQYTNINYLCPAEVQTLNLTDTGATVMLKNGSTLQARLIVGADGADSLVRHAAHIQTQSLNLKQKGIVATVTTEKPHTQAARQRFLATGPLAFLPLTDAHTCSIVWSADSARADELLMLDDATFIATLQKAFGKSLGTLQTVGPRAAFPLTLTHANSYTTTRLALIGDAAHTVHPLAGQGVNLGFLDAAALAEVLLDAVVRHKDIGAHSVLRRYERWRKAENFSMVAITGGFRYLFGNDIPGLSQLRNLGLNAADAATPLKNFIMRRASGVNGDLPKLSRRREHAVP
ncbi:MAG: UbiH/UbiF/VisC/COQ6 family ubiquinone biosynthesis hydroxylase [Gammaproteobacteria bacterium]|nr:UbiH/UbiF/VisC/COQ6 family ubiquinone biosynthesis hydroxylase [Gammaproteobacteria bacterium]